MLTSKLIAVIVLLGLFFCSTCNSQSDKRPLHITYTSKTKFYWREDTLLSYPELKISENGIYSWKDSFWDNDTLMNINIIPFSFVRKNMEIYIKYLIENKVDSCLVYSLSKKNSTSVLNLRSLTDGEINLAGECVFLREDTFAGYKVYVFKEYTGRRVFGGKELWSTRQTTLYIEKENLFPVKIEAFNYDLRDRLKRDNAFETLEIKSIK